MPNIKSLKKALWFPGVLLISLLTSNGYACSQEVACGKFSPPTVYESTDVLVLGSGAAGLTAAISAKDAGAKVVVLEKMPTIGGNSLLALGSFMATGSSQQDKFNLHASKEAFYLSFLGEDEAGTINHTLVRELVRKSGSAVDWLIKMGAGLTEVRKSFGTLEYREFHPKATIATGNEIIKALLRQLELKSVPVFTTTRADKIILGPNGEFNSVIATKGDGTIIQIEAKALVVATGGYAAAHEMLSHYKKDYARTLTSNQAGATGDGLIILDDIGANMLDLGRVQFHPTLCPALNVLVPLAVRNNGGFIVNERGFRFTNELASSDTISQAMIQESGATGEMYLIFDRKVAESVDGLDIIFNAGTYFLANTPNDLARLLLMPEDNLTETFCKVRDFHTRKATDEFGRSFFMSSLDTPPYFAIKVRAAMHYTPGGVEIDKDARVISQANSPIRGIYAAGEVTGGIHGSYRKGNSALTDAVVFGRIAGENAAKYALTHNIAQPNPELKSVKKKAFFGFLGDCE